MLLLLLSLLTAFEDHLYLLLQLRKKKIPVFDRVMLCGCAQSRTLSESTDKEDIPETETEEEEDDDGSDDDDDDDATSVSSASCSEVVPLQMNHTT